MHERKTSKPYLVFLDLNMPGMNGIEFLRELRDDPDLTHTVVFVLTTSGAETAGRVPMSRISPAA